MIRYFVLIEPKVGTYFLTVPDLPGCTSAGSTISEALNNGAEAVRIWVTNAGTAPPPRVHSDVVEDENVKAALAGGSMLAIVELDDIEREIIRAATHSSPDDDLRASCDDLKRTLDAHRQQATTDLNDRISSIEHETAERKQIEFLLSAIENNTKLTMESAKAINGNIFAIALMAAFWSAFVLWKNYDDVRAFYHATIDQIFHALP